MHIRKSELTVEVYAHMLQSAEVYVHILLEVYVREVYVYIHVLLHIREVYVYIPVCV